MKIKVSILILLFSMVLVISCAKDPNARSNNDFMQTSEDVELEDQGFR